MKRSFLPAFLVVLIICLYVSDAAAQVGIGTITPSAKAVLELKSPGNNQGFLVPRLTTAERTAITGLASAEKGLLVFDTTDDKFYYWSGSAWIVIEDSVGTGTVTNVATGAGLTGGPISVTGTISLADNGVTTVKINNDAVTSAKIANGSVTDAKIGTGITVSKLSASATAGQVLTTVGTATNWAALPDASATNEIQDLSLATNTLSLTGDATTVNLAPYLDNTDAQNLTLGTRTGTQQPVNISGGTGVTIDVADNDNSTTNEIQDLSLATNTLSLTGDATTVNLAPYLDNTDAQALTFTSPNLSIGGGNSVNLSAINTDAQTLAFTSPNLSISGGNSISLSAINTDNQDLSLVSNTLSLTGDATTVNLAPYLDNTDAQNLTLGTRTGTQQPVNISGGTGVTIDVADNDNSTTNEIQDLSIATNTLSLSGDATPVNLAGYLDNTDAQTLTFTPATSALAISGGNSVTVSATGTAGGDLSGTFPNPTVDALQGVGISATAPTAAGQVLKYNGTVWAPGPDNGTTPGLNAVLGTGNNAGTQAAINFSSISINRTDTPGALNVNGAHFVSVTTLGVVGTYAVAADDYLIIGTGTNGVQTTVTLPDASANIGRILIFKGRSVGSAAAAGLRVQAASGDTIDGVTVTNFLTPVGTALTSITIVAISASEWIIISKSVFGAF